MKRLRTLPALLLALPLAAHAARPMITDDARVVDPRSCQLETWTKHNANSDEYWALPGCNVGENLELTYGGALTREDGDSNTTDVILQAKTLFRPFTTNNYGIGLVVGHARHPSVDEKSSMLGDAYAYMPASFSLANDALILHVNLGWLHEKAEHQNKLTWGVGSETRLNERLQAIAEVFGDDREHPFYQVGLRYWLVRERVQIDTTYGNRMDQGNEDRWLSVGLRLLSPQLWH
jgi:hypothetical protein